MISDLNDSDRRELGEKTVGMDREPRRRGSFFGGSPMTGATSDPREPAFHQLAAAFAAIDAGFGR